MDRVETANPNEFADAVDGLLSRTENVIEVRHTSTVEATALKQLLSMMARKVQLQDHAIESQDRELRTLRAEVKRLRTETEGMTGIRNDVRKVHLEVEEQGAVLKRQQHALEMLRSEHDDMHVDIARALHSSERGAAAPSSSGSRVRPRHDEDFGYDNSDASLLAPLPQERHRDPDEAYTPPPPLNTAPIGAPAPDAHGTSSPRVPPSQRPLAGLELMDTTAGPKVSAVKPGGPAHAAGINVGDLIVRIAGKDVRCKRDFVVSLERCVPGQCVDVAFRRDGHAVTVTKVFLGGAPRR